MQQKTSKGNRKARMLRLPAVLDIVGIGKSAVYAEMSAGRFPKSIPIGPGGRARGWIDYEIYDHVEAQIAKARGAAA